MSGQDELERYEQTEAWDLIRLLEASRPPSDLRTPPDFRFKVFRQIEKKQSRHGVFSWLSGVFAPTWMPAAIAALLMLSLGVNAWLGVRVLGTSQPAVNRVASQVQTPDAPMRAHVFQQGIRHGADLGALVAAQSAESEPMSYAFAGHTSRARFFRLGALYAEALAFVRSGDLEAAIQRWQVMDRTLGQTVEPLRSYRRDIQRSLQQEPPRLEQFQTWLPLFESFYEMAAARGHEQTLPMFQAGAWMTNMRLAAMVGDVERLRRGRDVAYFILHLDAPKGVEQRLERLSALLAEKTLDKRELNRVDKLLKKMQELLG